MSDPRHFHAPHVGSKFSRLTCWHCKTDELHLRGRCIVCGHHVLHLASDPGASRMDADLKARIERRHRRHPNCKPLRVIA